MKHRHDWVPSVNSSCPVCQGSMELCSNGECRYYRCLKHGEFIQKMGDRYIVFEKV
jgi:hypothetical protein